MRIFVLSSVFFISASASAATTRVQSYSGVYDLECESLQINLHLGAAGWAGTAVKTFSANHNAALSCDPIVEGDSAYNDVYDDIYDRCPAWVGSTACDRLATSVADGYADFNNDLLDSLPYEMDFNVHRANWFNMMSGLYTAGAQLTSANGTANHRYILNRSGRFWGVAAGQMTRPDLNCAAVSVGAVDGQFTGSDVEVDWAVDAEWLCATHNSKGAGLAVSLGVAVGGQLEGTEQ